MNKMTDWFEIEYSVEATSKKVVRAFERWMQRNLTITHGSGKNANEIFGLPYTSSSDYAGLWNCQAEAHLIGDDQWKFESLAIAEDGKILAIFEHEDGTEETLDRKEIVIGSLKIENTLVRLKNRIKDINNQCSSVLADINALETLDDLFDIERGFEGIEEVARLSCDVAQMCRDYFEEVNENE